VDPTPAAAYEAAHGSIGGRSLEALRAWLGGWAAELQGYLRAGDARAALRRLRAEARALAAWAGDRGRLPLGLLGLAALAWVAWRRGLLARRHRAARLGPSPEVALQPELRALLARLDLAWKRKGRPRPTTHAWREHLEAIPRGDLTPELAAVSARVIDCYYRARYGGIEPQPEELRQTRQALQQALTKG
jgi:hypothetical protein